jgi:hypothetical protein
MGVRINLITNGPVVNESLESSIPGVFAAGNVLHVHDLVDYVSEEAAAAGRNAARYIASGMKEKTRHEILLTCKNGVRYTVPYSIDPAFMDDKLTVRFRIVKEFRNHFVSVYFDNERLIHRKRPILAPGEMEEAILEKQWFLERPDLSGITVTVEEM